MALQHRTSGGHNPSYTSCKELTTITCHHQLISSECLLCSDHLNSKVCGKAECGNRAEKSNLFLLSFLSPIWLCRIDVGLLSQLSSKVKVLVAKSCLTLCDPMDYSQTDSSIHGILQARILKWVAFSSPGNLPDPGIKPRSPPLQVTLYHLRHQGFPGGTRDREPALPMQET